MSIETEIATQRQRFKHYMYTFGSEKHRFWSAVWRTTGYLIGTASIAALIIIGVLIFS